MARNKGNAAGIANMASYPIVAFVNDNGGVNVNSNNGYDYGNNNSDYAVNESTEQNQGIIDRINPNNLVDNFSNLIQDNDVVNDVTDFIQDKINIFL